MPRRSEWSVTTNRRSDWDFVVIEKKVLIPLDDDPTSFTQEEGETFEGMADVVPQYKAILREDTAQVFYIGSQKYQPVPHRTVFAPILSAINPEFDVDATIKSVNHGAKVFAQFIYRQGIEIEGETIRGGIQIVNSLDGTFRLVMEGLIYRQRTNTTLLMSEFLSRFQRRHILGNYGQQDFANIARETLNTVSVRLGQLTAISSINVTEVAFQNVVNKIDMPKKYKELALEIWATPEIAELETADNVWAVLHILGYLGSHEISRSLNDEAMYRWQRNVDRVLARTVLSTSQEEVARRMQQENPRREFA